MKTKLLLLFTLSLVAYSYGQQEPRFTSFNTNQSFTAITVDGAMHKVWAAADKVGIFNIDTNQETLPDNFTIFNTDGVSPDLTKVTLKDISADLSGNIWVAHQGLNFNGGQGGLERIGSNGTIQHYSPDRNALGFQFYGRDGLGGLRLNAVTVDKNNRVWTVNRYHDLTTDGTYIITPGDISFKDENQTKFTTKGAWFAKDGKISTKPKELPYPAFTHNPKPSVTPQNRNMQAISTDDNSVWVGSWGYITKEGEQNLPNRVLKYDLDGEFLEQHTYADMKFSPGGIINGICANGSKGTWVTTSIVGKGFSVYKNDVWTHVNTFNRFAQIIPENARFNDNAIWKDKLGRVYLGTDKGLIVYKGSGDVTDPNSYKLYTNYDYGANSGNELNIVDTTMLSNNISGGSADPSNPYRSWIATDKGIMKIFVPIEGMEVYNVRGDFTTSYNESTKDTNENLKLITTLRNELSDEPTAESDTPGMAADGSLATVFRFETDDPSGHHKFSKPSYRLYIGPGPLSKIDTPEYIKQFGYFYLKNLNSYEDAPSSPDDLTYVEYLYKHPEYIDPNAYESDQIYALYDFQIVDVISNPDQPIILYKHKFKITIPPVLLAHGVWTDINSMQSLEDYLNANGYKGQTLKAWRTDKKAAEHPFTTNYYNANAVLDKTTDSWVIPTYINYLKEKAADNLISSGKVNIIVHSRGGLYTRAYIEGIDPNYTYKNNINSLITLNTPHFGSQAANLNLDKRVVLNNETQINTFINTRIEDLVEINVSSDGLSIGNISSAVIVTKLDRANQWGARNLMVEIDDLSKVVPYEDPEFIKNLNAPVYISNMKRVPLHVISSTFDPCEMYPFLCNDLQKIDGKLTKFVPKQFKVGIYLYNAAIMVTNDIPNGINNVLKHTFNGEESDVVVPLSSMQAGLGGTRFSSKFNQLTHSKLPTLKAIAQAPNVHQRIGELLKSNVNDETTTGWFTKNGISPSPLKYNFLPNFSGNNRKVYAGQTVEPKILINRDPLLFDTKVSGDILNFKVYAEHVDKIIVSCENQNLSEQFTYEIRMGDEINFENDFSFTIPDYFYGETVITAHGYREGIFGYASNTVTFDVGISPSVTLRNIKFTHSTTSVLNQENYNFTLTGLFSDGIERNINGMDGLQFSIEDNTVISKLDNFTLKAEASGSTHLTATINALEDSMLITVEENPALFHTIITDFYGQLNASKSSINVFWETLREYENANFVLESSFNTPNNFSEVNQQAGNGTSMAPAQFNYSDGSIGSNTLIYYRLKMIDTSGNFTYSSTITIDLSTLSNDDKTVDDLGLKLFPNPVGSDHVTLAIDSNISDTNAKLEVFSLQGKKLSSQHINIIQGSNTFKLQLPNQISNGIYLVRISTNGFIKTIKLVVKK